jgi:DNA mismatch endonuclease, patch repair protein
MVDLLSRAHRSWNMSRIRSRDTAPEVFVRSMLHNMGLRFRLHSKSLPGRPDVVLPRWQSVIFVHGCFWHRHEGCRYAYTPKSRIGFWLRKFDENTRRDRRQRAALQQAGWRVIVVWECETERPLKLNARLRRMFRQ